MSKKVQIKIKSAKFFVADTIQRHFWQNLVSGKWEPETFTILDQFLDSDHAYLDVGAWIGPTALYAAFKAKRVYAIEPDNAAYRELCTNVSLNKKISSKIVCLNIALADKKGQFKLHCTNPGDSMSSFLRKAENSGIVQKVKGETLAQLISQYQIKDLNFIKIDIEGGEYSLLPSMKEFLKENRPTIYLSLHPNFLADGLQERLTAKNPLFRKLYDILLFKKFMLYISTKIPTLRLLQSLNSYNNFYDQSGNGLNFCQILFCKRFAEFSSLVASDLSFSHKK